MRKWNFQEFLKVCTRCKMPIKQICHQIFKSKSLSTKKMLLINPISMPHLILNEWIAASEKFAAMLLMFYDKSVNVDIPIKISR